MGLSNRARFTLDASLLVALLVAFFPSSTGMSVHEWLSLAIITPALFHLIVNWDWVVRIGARLLGKLRTASRVNLAVDTVLFVSTVAVMLSGFMISQVIAGSLGVTTTPSLAWYVVHSFSAKLTIALIIVHLALHWRWVANTLSAWRSTPGVRAAQLATQTPRRNDVQSR